MIRYNYRGESNWINAMSRKSATNVSRLQWSITVLLYRLEYQALFGKDAYAAPPKEERRPDRHKSSLPSLGILSTDDQWDEGDE